ncbi:hypothetical protein [Microvirga calopogonii]|uniref:hypothetical protein n=1 Tax=Microvirga calopogonii TaxID=2078013 RepID=UPI0013B43A60|nr:hypothetical protein [Microvirga calopogonii]
MKLSPKLHCNGSVTSDIDPALISGENTMGVDKQSLLQGRLADFEKAVRRGKKFEKTLLKIIAQSEPGSDIENLAKSVQQGLKILKKEIKKAERSPISDAKKELVQRKPASKAVTPSDASEKPVRRSRKKEPARTDLATGENQPMPDASK